MGFPVWIEIKQGYILANANKLFSRNGSVTILPESDTLIVSIITGFAYVIGMFGQFPGGELESYVGTY